MALIIVVDRCQYNVHEDVDVHNNVDEEEHCEPVVLIIRRHPTMTQREDQSHMS